MNIYLLNIIVVLILGFYQENNIQYFLLRNKKYNISTIIAVVTVFILMCIEMGLRGDFATDTLNYYYIYSSYMNNQSYFEIYDFGFFQIMLAIFQKMNASYLLFLIIIGVIIAYAYSKFMINYSDMFWLSALLLFCGGSFYTGFNVMRQILAASLVALSYKYIFSKEIVKYFIVIILTSTIHLSALIMIPMYFLLKHEWNFKKNRYIKIICIGIVCVIFYFFSPSIVNFVSSYVYTGYHSSSAYGINEGIGILGTLKAIVLSSGVIINSKYFDFSNTKECAIYNGCIMYLILAICGANVFIVQRLTHYFVPCLLVAYPHIISNIQNKKNKAFSIALVAILFIFSGINNVIDPGYYFYWDNKYVRW